MKKLLHIFFLVSVLVLTGCVLTGCAKVPLSDEASDTNAKQFKVPAKNKAGLYIYRDSIFGSMLKKNIYIDDKFIGESAPKVFFYRLVNAGKHKISTESEFSNNDLTLDMQGGKNYFVRNYMKPGVFIGGANLEQVDEQKAKQIIQKLKLAKSQ